MKALLVGHLSPSLAPAVGFSAGEEQLAEAPGEHYRDRLAVLAEALTDWEVEVLPFGPGRIFTEAVPGSLSLPRDASDPVVLPATGPLLVEMGHDVGHDWGRRLWAANREEDLVGRDLTVAYSTARPLKGPDATSNTDPHLGLRPVIEEPDGLIAHLRQLSHRQLPLADPRPREVDLRPGSGAGGGAAAWLMALGARAFPTAQLLADHLGLADRIGRADLVILATPHWHSPDLAESIPIYAAEVAAERAIPVVGVGFRSSLSPHEQAQWGLQGLHLARDPGRLGQLGRRVAQTWSGFTPG